MHELKFFIKFWKKNQRFLQNKSHVKKKRMKAFILKEKTVFKKLLLKKLVSFLKIEEIDLWHERRNKRNEETVEMGRNKVIFALW